MMPATVQSFVNGIVIRIPRAWQILAAVIALFYSPASASNSILYTLGNWRLEIITENRSIQLIGVGNPSGFYMQCYAEAGDSTVALWMLTDRERSTIRNQSLRVLMWNENNEPRQLTMIAMPPDRNFFAVAMTAGGNQQMAREVAGFLMVVESAEKFIAIDAGGETRRIDATHLPAALKVFHRSCEKIRMDFNSFATQPDVN